MGGGTPQEEVLLFQEPGAFIPGIAASEHPENPHSQPPPGRKLRVGGAERRAAPWAWSEGSMRCLLRAESFPLLRLGVSALLSPGRPASFFVILSYLGPCRVEGRPREPRHGRMESHM